jgi:rRNA maturation endonuclease Nob1
MPRENYAGKCEACGQVFHWYLIHNGFNSSCHAYCSRCGTTAIVSLYLPLLRKANASPGGITSDLEPLFACCGCGGTFRADSHPRCPSCFHQLSPREASKYIESSMPGAQKGWRWQQLWTGQRALYAVIINDRWMEDPLIAQSC